MQAPSLPPSSTQDPADLNAFEVAKTLHAREAVANALGMYLVEAREGFASVRMLIRADMLNGHSTVHGGMIFTLADTAFAYACYSRNLSTIAAQASIIFLSPSHEGETLIAEAREHGVSGRSGVYGVEVITLEGRLVASFRGLARSIGGPVVDLQENQRG